MSAASVMRPTNLKGEVAGTDFPPFDFTAIWAALPPERQAAIGALAIENNFLLFVSDELQGDTPDEGIVYLDAAAREAASIASSSIAQDLSDAIQSALPDIFGENPSPEHPRGTDPAWATPIRFKIDRGGTRRESG